MTEPVLRFSAVLAISLLKQKHHKNDVIDLVSHWDGAILEVNRKMTEIGDEKFEEWIKTPGSAESEALLKKRAALVAQFRNNFLQVLKDFCIPMIKAEGPVQDVDWHESQNITHDFLNLLPRIGVLETDAGSHQSQNR